MTNITRTPQHQISDLMKIYSVFSSCYAKEGKQNVPNRQISAAFRCKCVNRGQPWSNTIKCSCNRIRCFLLYRQNTSCMCWSMISYEDNEKQFFFFSSAQTAQQNKCTSYCQRDRPQSKWEQMNTTSIQTYNSIPIYK